ncbi:MAG TPA: hypothetical protein VHM90_05410 [Phycisphaerae bacterium]|jgi:hypothetical protein|nr:hypothetical protein [Phycisphaerae bacterium]
MGLIDNFKRDIGRHRGRSAVLGVLFVAMVLFSVRAFLQLSAKPAVASLSTPFQPATVNPVASADTQVRLQESQELWAKLREKKPNAADSMVAFKFDSSFYPAPVVPELPKQPNIAPTPDPVRVAQPSLPDPALLKRQRIHEQARLLVLKSTMVGEGITQPAAIINQRLLTVGQEISGFTLTAIRSREVDVEKEGQTEVVKMPDGQ